MKTLYESIVKQKKEFIIIKPGFLKYLSPILEILKDNHVVVVRELRQVLSLKNAKKLYSMHKDKDYFDELCTYMSSDDSVGMVCVNYGSRSMDDIKDEIRKKYADPKDPMLNCIHSSDKGREEKESKIYFANKQ